MGKIYPDLAGAFRGSVGKVSYYLRADENIARRKGEERKASDSPAAVEQRKKFGTIVKISSVMLAPIKLGFPQHDRRLSETNVFHKLNKDICTVEGDIVTVDYEHLLCANGPLVVPEVKANYNTGTNKFIFENNAMEQEVNCNTDDLVYAVLLDNEQWFCRVMQLRNRGESGSTSMNLPSTWNIEHVIVYVFAVSADKQKVSRSQYLIPEKES